MSSLNGVVGNRKIRWIKAPVGSTGSGEVDVDGKIYTVSWKRDSDGVWMQFAHGCFGFDIYGESEETGADLVFRISHRGTNHVTSGLRFKGAGEVAAAAAAPGGKKKALRVRAQMPGKIVRVLVKAGDEVVKDQPLLVMEAMKMENEIRAAGAGKIESVKVAEGQAVESGADLIVIGG